MDLLKTQYGGTPMLGFTTKDEFSAIVVGISPVRQSKEHAMFIKKGWLKENDFRRISEPWEAPHVVN